MIGENNILDAIKEFVGSERAQSVKDRVSKFIGKVAAKGDLVDTPIFRKPTVNTPADLIIEFFAPIGYRQLFEEEIIFLVSEGISYWDIMQMPVYLRKRIIDRKLGREKSREDMFENHSLLDQIRQSQEASGISTSV